MSISADSNIFSALIEKLLAGDVVCAITVEPLYKYLQDQNQQQDVDVYLRRIGRMLRCTQDGSGYFAAYRNIADASVKQQIKQRFSEVINDLEPMIRWLRLATTVKKSEAALQPGDTLRGSDLLEAIENAPALVEELDRLSRSRLFKNSSTGAKKQLDSILRKLCDTGYLVTRGVSGSVFVATGKWARLYDELQFISAHEQLDAEEDVPIQAELLF
jgi:hypothetical protein